MTPEKTNGEKILSLIQVFENKVVTGKKILLPKVITNNGLEFKEFQVKNLKGSDPKIYFNIYSIWNPSTSERSESFWLVANLPSSEEPQTINLENYTEKAAIYIIGKIPSNTTLICSRFIPIYIVGNVRVNCRIIMHQSLTIIGAFKQDLKIRNGGSSARSKTLIIRGVQVGERDNPTGSKKFDFQLSEKDTLIYQGELISLKPTQLKRRFEVFAQSQINKEIKQDLPNSIISRPAIIFKRAEEEKTVDVHKEKKVKIETDLNVILSPEEIAKNRLKATELLLSHQISDYKSTEVTNIELRPYQKKVIEQIISHRKAKGKDPLHMVVPLFTGFGKSVIMQYLAEFEIRAGNKILIVVPSQALLEQFRNNLGKQKKWRIGSLQTIDQTKKVNESTLKKEIAKNDICLVISNTLVNIYQNLKNQFPFENFSIVFLDEAHHFRSEKWDRILTYAISRKTAIVPVTATPFPLNGQGKDPYQLIGLEAETNPVSFLGIKDAIEQKIATPLQFINLIVKTDANQNKNRKKIVEFNKADSIAELLYTGGDPVTAEPFWKYPILVFAGKVKFAELIKKRVLIKGNECYQLILDAIIEDRWKKYQIKYPVANKAKFKKDFKFIEVIKSESDSKNTEKIIQDFLDGKILVIVAPRKLSEGFDFPELSTVIIACLSSSKCLLLQQVGRGLRIDKGRVNTKLANCIQVFSSDSTSKSARRFILNSSQSLQDSNSFTIGDVDQARSYHSTVRFVLKIFSEPTHPFFPINEIKGIKRISETNMKVCALILSYAVPLSEKKTTDFEKDLFYFFVSHPALNKVYEDACSKITIQITLGENEMASTYTAKITTQSNNKPISTIHFNKCRVISQTDNLDKLMTVTNSQDPIVLLLNKKISSLETLREILSKALSHLNLINNGEYIKVINNIQLVLSKNRSKNKSSKSIKELSIQDKMHREEIRKELKDKYIIDEIQQIIDDIDNQVSTTSAVVGDKLATPRKNNQSKLKKRKTRSGDPKKLLRLSLRKYELLNSIITKILDPLEEDPTWKKSLQNSQRECEKFILECQSSLGNKKAKRPTKEPQPQKAKTKKNDILSKFPPAGIQLLINNYLEQGKCPTLSAWVKILFSLINDYKADLSIPFPIKIFHPGFSIDSFSTIFLASYSCLDSHYLSNNNNIFIPLFLIFSEEKLTHQESKLTEQEFVHLIYKLRKAAGLVIGSEGGSIMQEKICLIFRLAKATPEEALSLVKKHFVLNILNNFFEFLFISDFLNKKLFKDIEKSLTNRNKRMILECWKACDQQGNTVFHHVFQFKFLASHRKNVVNDLFQCIPKEVLLTVLSMRNKQNKNIYQIMLDTDQQRYDELSFSDFEYIVSKVKRKSKNSHRKMLTPGFMKSLVKATMFYFMDAHFCEKFNQHMIESMTKIWKNLNDEKFDEKLSNKVFSTTKEEIFASISYQFQNIDFKDPLSKRKCLMSSLTIILGLLKNCLHEKLTQELDDLSKHYFSAFQIDTQKREESAILSQLEPSSFPSTDSMMRQPVLMSSSRFSVFNHGGGALFQSSSKQNYILPGL